MASRAAKLKTTPGEGSVAAFLAGVPDEARRRDARAVLEMMQEITGEPPRMWGTSIVGFGSYRYRYASGREGEWFLTGFSPRKANLTLYIMSGFEGSEDLLGRLGRHKTGKGCLHLKRLADADPGVLRELIRRSVRRPMGGSG